MASTPPTNSSTTVPDQHAASALAAVPEPHRSWLRHVSELDAEDAGDADWLIPGILARGEHHQLVAPPKEGKTILALAVAVSVAAGLPFAGWPKPSAPAPVIIIAEEGRRRDLQDQLERIAAGLGVNLEELPIYVAHRQAFRLDDAAWVQRVCAVITYLQPGLLVLDHLTAMHRLDENPAAEMGRLLDSLNSFLEVKSRRLGRPGQATTVSPVRTAVLLLHHARKEAAASSSYQGRGSSALPAAADAIWGIRSKKDNAGKLQRLDVQYSGRRPLEPLAVRVEETGSTLRLIADDTTSETRDRGSNGKGHADILAQVLAYLSAVGPTARKDLPSAIGKNKKAVLDAIRAGIADGVLNVIERDGKELIHIKVVPITARTLTLQQGET